MSSVIVLSVYRLSAAVKQGGEQAAERAALRMKQVSFNSISR